MLGRLDGDGRRARGGGQRGGGDLREDEPARLAVLVRHRDGRPPPLIGRNGARRREVCVADHVSLGRAAHVRRGHQREENDPVRQAHNP